MIIGTGVDIIEVSRIKRAVTKWHNSFLKKIFTDKELEYSRERTTCYQHLAGRFAAKEAVLKALGNGWTNRTQWCDIEVENETSGKPTITLKGETKRLSRQIGVDHIVVSISHTRTYAVANVILTKNGKE